jgi:hypothetical protein
MKPAAHGLAPAGGSPAVLGGLRCSLMALAAAAGLAGVAPASLAAVIAADSADNDPYPVTNWQPGDNGGYGFQPWIALERGTPGARYLTGWIVEGHRYAWGMNGTYAFGRGLTSPLNGGTCRATAVHGSENGSFSGFNLKTSTQPGLAAGEILRFGINPGAADYRSGTIQVSTNCGATYVSLDCGWPVGLGDTIEYAATWSAVGVWWLEVSNLADGLSASFVGLMSPGAVAMLGAASEGATLSEDFAFDGLALEWETNSPPWLSIRLCPGDRVALWWPAPAYGWYLQQSPSLITPDWSDVSEPPQQVVGGWQVVLPAAPPPVTMFFRLKKEAP